MNRRENSGGAKTGNKAGGKNDPWNLVARYAGVAMLLPASAFVGYAIGYGLDHLFSTGFLKVTFLLLGVASGLVQVIRELSRDA